MFWELLQQCNVNQDWYYDGNKTKSGFDYSEKKARAETLSRWDSRMRNKLRNINTNWKDLDHRIRKLLPQSVDA